MPEKPQPGVQHAVSPSERVAIISHVSLWSFLAPSPWCSQSAYCEYHIKVCVYEKGPGHREGGGGGTCPWGLTAAILFLSRGAKLFSPHPVRWATGLLGTKGHSQQAFQVLVETFCSFKVPGLQKAREKLSLKPGPFLLYSLTLRSGFWYPAEHPAPPAIRHQLLLQASPTALGPEWKCVFPYLTGEPSESQTGLANLSPGYTGLLTSRSLK